MYRFIHIADVHLDSTFATKREKVRDELKKALFSSFEKTIQLCIDKEVHALLIAGDLFESPLLSFKTERFIMMQFKKLKAYDIKVFYAIGNHDAGVTQQKRDLNWPENVYLFEKAHIETATLEIEGMKPCSISGCGHQSQQDTRQMAASFPMRDSTGLHVGVFHTMVLNAKEIDNDCYYLPCHVEELEAKKYNYWALGHIHKRQQVGSEPIYYAGNPQGIKTKETGEKGVYYVEISNAGDTHVEFLKTCAIQWVELCIDITGFESNDVLFNALKQSILEVQKNHVEPIIPRVILKGATLLKEQLKKEDYVKELMDGLRVELDLIELVIKSEQVKRPYDPEFIENGEHMIKELMTLIDALNKDHPLMESFKDLELANSDMIQTEAQMDYLLTLIKNSKEPLIDAFLGAANES